ncbi:hypothetical protein D3C72_1835910 [compost metagenome]
MSAVGQNRKLDHPRPSAVHQSIHRSPDCPPRVEDVVEQDNLLIPGAEDSRRDQQTARLLAAIGASSAAGLLKVVAIRRDVELAAGYIGSFDLLDPVRDPPGQIDAPGADADQHTVLDPFVLLQDFVGNARQRSADRRFIHNDVLLGYHA